MTADIRVLIVDDRALIRAGLRAVLDRHDAIEVVGEASGTADAQRQALRLRPDVVLADADMPGLDVPGLVEAVADGFRDGGGPRVLLTARDHDAHVQRAVRSGAAGAVLSGATPEQLASAVLMVAAGYGVFAAPPTGTASAPRWPTAPCMDMSELAAELRRADVLTPREREVLHLLAQGLSNAEMSAALVLSESTVKSHVQHILDKLRLRNRVHAVIYAHRSGLASTGG
ncbi:LuxR C-terminal-related transcriptional regulator [Streptomyces sp. NPDC002644]